MKVTLGLFVLAGPFVLLIRLSWIKLPTKVNLLAVTENCRCIRFEYAAAGLMIHFNEVFCTFALSFLQKARKQPHNINVWMEENNSEQVNQNKVLGLNNNLWCSDRTELVYSLIWLFKETIQSDFVVTVPLLQSCPWFLKQIWFRTRRNKNCLS